MSWKKIKFGTDGWRAIIAEDFTFENVALVTASIAKYIEKKYGKEKPILLSYDPRFLADKFAQYSAQVLNSLGFSTLIVNRDCPTPVIAFAAKHLNSAGALQFTASHNPPEYCGLKYIPDYAGPANEEITNQIKGFVDELGQKGFISPSFDFHHEYKNEKHQIFSPKEDYLKTLKELIDFPAIKASGLKIGVDSLNGAGRGYFDEILNCQVILGQERDPLFRGMLPEPTEKTLQELIKSIKTQKLDIGLSNDGDADRFAIIDSEGLMYSPNQILAILSKYLIEERNFKGSIVRTVATTHLLDRLAKKLGVNIVETAVGFKYIAEVMLKEKVIIGGEESGGLSILGHIPEKDGILACSLVCEAIVKTKKSLSQLWQETIKFAEFEPQNKRLDLHLTNELKEKIMQDLKNSTPKEFASLKVINVILKDGVKLVLENGDWILVRPSGTEPLLRVYLESSSVENLKTLEKEANRVFS